MAPNGRLGAGALGTAAAQVATSGLMLLVAPPLAAAVGPAGYGIVGLATAVQQALAFLDLGLGVSAAREFARSGEAGASAGDRPVLLRSLEWLYLATALLVVLVAGGWAVWFLGDASASAALPLATIRRALAILVGVVALRWPLALYVAALRGQEQHARLAALAIAGALARSVGGLAAARLSTRPLEAFFVCQAVVALLEVAAHAGLAWHSIGGGRAWRRARLDPARLRGLVPVTAGVFVASLMAAVLKQADRFVLAHAVSLAELGHYTLAATLGSVVSLAVTPVLVVSSPRLAALHGAGRADELRGMFHGASELVACVAAPLAWALVFEGPGLLALWTTDVVAQAAGGTLRVLGAAALLNSAMQVPFLLLVASGRTRTAALANTVGAVLTTPLMWGLVHRQGIVGAGVGWLAFNVGYLAILPPVLARRILPGAWRGWAGRAVAGPTAVAGAAMLGGVLATARMAGPWRALAACAVGWALFALAYGALAARGHVLGQARHQFLGPPRTPGAALGA